MANYNVSGLQSLAELAKKSSEEKVEASCSKPADAGCSKPAADAPCASTTNKLSQGECIRRLTSIGGEF